MYRTEEFHPLGTVEVQLHWRMPEPPSFNAPFTPHPFFASVSTFGKTAQADVLMRGSIHR